MSEIAMPHPNEILGPVFLTENNLTTQYNYELPVPLAEESFKLNVSLDEDESTTTVIDLIRSTTSPNAVSSSPSSS